MSKLVKLMRSWRLFAFGRDPEQHVLSTHQESRLHGRFPLRDSEASLTINGLNLRWQIIDISYGGIAIRSQNSKDSPKELPDIIEGKISLFNSQSPCSLNTIRTLSEDQKIIYAGLSFRHTTSGILIFLRSFLEPLRWGVSLSAIAKEFRAEKYREQGWECLRGDGPTDLTFFVGQKGLETALLTFKFDQSYAEVRYKEGSVVCGLATVDGHDLRLGARMESLAEINPQILRDALAILTSLNQQYYHSLRPFALEMRRLLDLSIPEENTPLEQNSSHLKTKLSI